MEPLLIPWRCEKEAFFADKAQRERERKGERRRGCGGAE